MQAKEQINILQNRIAELELENKNLHETVAYLTKNYMVVIRRHQSHSVSMDRCLFLMKRNLKRILRSKSLP